MRRMSTVKVALIASLKPGEVKEMDEEKEIRTSFSVRKGTSNYNSFPTLGQCLKGAEERAHTGKVKEVEVWARWARLFKRGEQGYRDVYLKTMTGSKAR